VAPDFDAIVVGGGFAGVRSARDLGDAGRSVLLVEELAPCTFRGRHGGELVYLLAGRVTARPGDGSPAYEMRAGEVGWFEAGLWDEWVVEETYRKFLFAATDTELPY
jgi:choline dehydrogenase-like flavoprotein